MTAEEFMARAERALKSARLLLDAGDADGASNRIYYAMFDAAKAALLTSGAAAELVETRTHGGLIAGFGPHMVKSGLISVEHGRAFNRVNELRLIADSRGDAIARDGVEQALVAGVAFVAAVAALRAPPIPR